MFDCQRRWLVRYLGAAYMYYSPVVRLKGLRCPTEKVFSIYSIEMTDVRGYPCYLQSDDKFLFLVLFSYDFSIFKFFFTFLLFQRGMVLMYFFFLKRIT